MQNDCAYFTDIPVDDVPLKEVGEVGGATATPSASTGSWLGRVPGSFLPEPPPQVESPKKQQSSPNRVSLECSRMGGEFVTEGHSSQIPFVMLEILKICIFTTYVALVCSLGCQVRASAHD